MNKAKTVYYDKKGNMIKSTRYVNKDSLIKFNVEQGGIVHKKNMKLMNVTWQNSGVTFWFKDDADKYYPMTDTVFNEYLKDNPISFGDVDIEFLQQGYVYSIGFAKENKE